MDNFCIECASASRDVASGPRGYANRGNVAQRATAQMALMHHLPTYLHHELMRFIVARQHASSCHIDKVVREVDARA